MEGHHIMANEFNFFIPITKVDKERRTVSGYCTTPALDLDGEIITLDAVKKAAPGYWEWRNIRSMHSANAVGVGKELNIDNKGAFLTAKIVDEDAWKKCLEGVYKGFSIGGKKLEKTGNTITAIDWIETSIVDRPANPECKFDVAKRARDGKDAYLVKARTSPAEKALLNMSKAALLLAKVENEPDPGPLADTPPPRPNTAKEAGGEDTQECAKHGIMNCAKCAAKAAKRAAKKAIKKDFTAEVIPGDKGETLRISDPQENEPGKATKKQAQGGQQPTKSGGDDGGYIEPPAKKVKKRKVSTGERHTLASEGNALPGGGFPIKNKGDLANARRAIGRAKNPGAARALIRRRAKELGVELPETWTKKQARALLAKAEQRPDPPASSSFLSLSAGGAALGSGRLSPDLGDDDFNDFLSLRRGSRVPSLGGAFADPNLILRKEDLTMDNELDGLDSAILDIVKRAAQPTRAQRMSMAQSNMKKASKARKAARDEIENVHKMLKKAYLAKDAMAKAGKKPAADGDADDMECMSKAMSGLQKAYGEIQKMGTFMKASRDSLEKLSRSGQREQEPSHGEPGYKVPPGVMDLDPDELAAASPGTPGRRGSMPPKYPGSEGTEPQSVYAGKAAKLAKNGMVSVEMAAMLAENARLEAQVATVTHLPQTGRRPYAADMTKFGQPVGGGPIDPVFKAMKDAQVDPSHLMTQPDESGQEDPRRRLAVAKTVGQYLHPDSGNGRSAILDSSFKGRAA